jgi:ethanolaminephosphotransferase
VAAFIDKELQKQDWSALVVHFPGLDHLAHMGGAYSPYMHSKQQEMDQVVRKVYRSIERETPPDRTLLVLLGDHGMDDLGQHGGDSVEELSTALLFISPLLQTLHPAQDESVASQGSGNPYKDPGHVSQLDIVPTISGLLGLPLPLDNLGSFIPDFLPLWESLEDRRLLIRQNLAQLGMSYNTNASILDPQEGISQGLDLAKEVSLLSMVSIHTEGDIIGTKRDRHLQMLKAWSIKQQCNK